MGFPLFGQSEVHGIEWATLADNAAAFWQAGEDGFIGIDVSSHGSAGQNLANIAQAIVPKFKP